MISVEIRLRPDGKLAMPPQVALGNSAPTNMKAVANALAGAIEHCQLFEPNVGEIPPLWLDAVLFMSLEQ